MHGQSPFSPKGSEGGRGGCRRIIKKRLRWRREGGREGRGGEESKLERVVAEGPEGGVYSISGRGTGQGWAALGGMVMLPRFVAFLMRTTPLWCFFHVFFLLGFSCSTDPASAAFFVLLQSSTLKKESCSVPRSRSAPPPPSFPLRPRPSLPPSLLSFFFFFFFVSTLLRAYLISLGSSLAVTAPPPPPPGRTQTPQG